MSRSNLISIIIVVVALSLLGGAFWRYDGSQGNKADTTADSKTPGLKTGQNEAVSLPPPVSEKASQQEKDAFVKAILGISQGGSLFTLQNGCYFSPKVLRVEEGTKITIKNTDTVAHTIYTLQELAISAGEEKTITASFKPGKGLYGLNCDGPTTVAYLWIE